MKFSPRPLLEEVNVSREHPLKEFLLLAGGIVGGFFLLYLLLGFALDHVVPRIGIGLEEKLGKVFLSAYGDSQSVTAAEKRLQRLLDEVAEGLDGKERDYRVHLEKSERANALALPGGHIVVMSALVEEAQSENEMAMILGHELGHFQGRDHLRGLGRGLVLVFITSLLFGADSSLSNVTTSLLGGAETQFSQRQELAADAMGVELLVKRYGHAGGAAGFFERLAAKEEGKEYAYFFATHPYPRERVEEIGAIIARKSYPVGDVLPLDKAFLDGDIFKEDESPGEK